MLTDHEAKLILDHADVACRDEAKALEVQRLVREYGTDAGIFPDVQTILREVRETLRAA